MQGHPDWRCCRMMAVDGAVPSGGSVWLNLFHCRTRQDSLSRQPTCHLSGGRILRYQHVMDTILLHIQRCFQWYQIHGNLAYQKITFYKIFSQNWKCFLMGQLAHLIDFSCAQSVFWCAMGAGAPSIWRSVCCYWGLHLAKGTWPLLANLAKRNVLTVLFFYPALGA